MVDPLSIVSTVLQTVSLLWRRGERGRRVVVQVQQGFLVYGFTPEGLGDLAIVAHATNDGEGIVVLESAGLTLESGSTVLPPPVQLEMFPRRLSQGEKQSVWFEVEHLVAAIRDKPELGLPKVAWFTDSAGREHRCGVPGYVRATIRNYLARSKGSQS